MGLDIKKFAAKVRELDGAWGTQLQNRGLPPGSPPELWNEENPAAVSAVAAGYIQAGSDVILTNTFGANRIALGPHGLADRAARLAEAGAAISRRAADAVAAAKRPKVFASIGPTGKVVMMDETPPEAIAAAFAEAAEAAQWGGADAIVLETFNELAELKIALAAVLKAADLPVVACMTFTSGPDKTRSMMGDSPADLAAMAKRAGASAVGANCGLGPDGIIPVCRMLRRASGLPIWIKPNAGLPAAGADGRTIFPMGPEEFASFAGKLIEAGANFIGGCCGTTPAHIEAVREVVSGKV